MRRASGDGALRPRAVHQLPLGGAAPPFVCFALPPRRVGNVVLADWWCGFGSGITLGEARRRAISEIVERASAVFQGHEPHRRATLQDLGDDAVAPESFLLFSPRQRQRPIRSRSPMLRVPPVLPPDEPVDWSPVRSLTEGRWKRAPTAALYFKAPVAGRGYCRADSNGLAAGRTRTEAILRGLLELIERDSVSLWWYQRIARPALPRLTDPVVQDLLERFRRLGRTTALLDLTSDLRIPVCAALSRRAARGDDLALGFGAALTRAGAARRALLELAQPLAVRRAGWPGGEGTGAFERWRREQRDPAPRWLRPAAGRLPRIASGPTPSTAAALARCRRAVEAAGLEVLVADLTRPGAGRAVVRVLVPGLRHFWPRLAPGRLYHAPVRAGWVRRTQPESRLNPVPLLV